MATPNEYLQQVEADQARVDQELRNWRARAPAAPAAIQAALQRSVPQSPQAALPSADLPSRAVDYKITGFGPWRTVVVPPNVYVVHTRRGREQPLHIGMGISFRYNPNTDAFLVIP